MGRDDFLELKEIEFYFCFWWFWGVISPSSVIANNVFVHFAVGILFKLEFSEQLSVVSDVDEPWQY